MTADILNLQGKQIEKIIRNLKDGAEITKTLPADEAFKIYSLIVAMLLEEVRQGHTGKETPFYDEVKKIMRPEGCYFCDSDIDPNATPFAWSSTNLCITCTLKVANILQAFGIDPRSIFPNIRVNQKQKVLFEEIK